MKQIRICWNDEVSHLKHEMLTSGEWAEATPERVYDYEIMVRAGNEVFGEGTHWSEEREVPGEQVFPERAIKTLIARSMQAWIEGDMRAHIAYFTPAAVFVTPSGECHRGRSALLRAFEAERAAMPDLKMIPERVQIIHPAQDGALILMEGAIQHSGHQESERWVSTQMAVLVPKEGWKIASLQVSHARERHWLDSAMRAFGHRPTR